MILAAFSREFLIICMSGGYVSCKDDALSLEWMGMIVSLDPLEEKLNSLSTFGVTWETQLELSTVVQQ